MKVEIFIPPTREAFMERAISTVISLTNEKEQQSYATY
jgi:hypothetical protein